MESTLHKPALVSNATKRWILRSIHLLLSIPIIGYIYSPFDQIPNYAPVPGLSSFLCLFFRDFGCGKAMSFDGSFRKDRPNKTRQRSCLRENTMRIGGIKSQ